jgi:hypothetical protein
MHVIENKIFEIQNDEKLVEATILKYNDLKQSLIN